MFALLSLKQRQTFEFSCEKGLSKLGFKFDPALLKFHTFQKLWNLEKFDHLDIKIVKLFFLFFVSKFEENLLHKVYLVCQRFRPSNSNHGYIHSRGKFVRSNKFRLKQFTVLLMKILERSSILNKPNKTIKLVEHSLKVTTAGTTRRVCF